MVVQIPAFFTAFFQMTVGLRDPPQVLVISEHPGKSISQDPQSRAERSFIDSYDMSQSTKNWLGYASLYHNMDKKGPGNW